MSNRFPALAPQDPTSAFEIRLPTFSLPRSINLPWFEFLIGATLLVMLRGV